jgi:hypothetical protein
LTLLEANGERDVALFRRSPIEIQKTLQTRNRYSSISKPNVRVRFRVHHTLNEECVIICLSLGTSVSRSPCSAHSQASVSFFCQQVLDQELGSVLSNSESTGLDGITSIAWQRDGSQTVR